MSPLLFTRYSVAMIEAIEGLVEGIKFNGKLLQDVTFEVDQGMIASTEDDLQRIMDRLS